MRRLRIAPGGCAAMAAVAVALAGGGRPLPLHAPPAATSPPLAIVSGRQGARLAQLDQATFAARRESARVGWLDGWAVSPDRTLVAVGTDAGTVGGGISTLRFANVATLRWVRRGVRLDGLLRAAIWPRAGALYALVGDCCGAGFELETVDTVAKTVVARTAIPAEVTTVARSAAGLVLLGETSGAIAPVQLIAVGAEGDVRSVRLERIRAGTRFDPSQQDPIGTTREPGLAVDPVGGVAYVVDPGGLVAEVRLSDLSVSYHELGRSIFARLSAWLTPAAEAKGLNGPTLSARWLGDGLIAVTGTNASARKQRSGAPFLSSTPAGLRVIDTRGWSERTLDPGAGAVTVADGLLLATGGTWRSDGSTSTASGEGLAAYGADGSLRWRLEPGADLVLVASYGSRALVQRIAAGQGGLQPLQLVDLDTGRVVRTLPGDAYPSLLLAPSPAAAG